MKTVILDVRKPGEAMADFTNVWKTGKPQKSARISFATPELLWRVLTPKRWALLKVLCGAGPVSIREAARRAGRDVKVELLQVLRLGCADTRVCTRTTIPYARQLEDQTLPNVERICVRVRELLAIRR